MLEYYDLSPSASVQVGCDIVEIIRITRIIQRYPQRFIQKILTPLEQTLCPPTHSPKFIRHLAKRFAAKEACAKALGTGFGSRLQFHDIQVQNNAQGAPYVQLSKALVKHHNLKSLTLSLSDERAYALAICYAHFDPLPV